MQHYTAHISLGKATCHASASLQAAEKLYGKRLNNVAGFGLHTFNHMCCNMANEDIGKLPGASLTRKGSGADLVDTHTQRSALTGIGVLAAIAVQVHLQQPICSGAEVPGLRIFSKAHC